MEISDRLRQILEYYNLKVPKFASSIGINQQRIYDVLQGRTKSITYELGDAIQNAYPYININWLRTGEGEMLLTTPGTQVYNNVSGHHNTANGICSGNSLCGSSQDEVNAMAAEIERLKAECKHRDELLQMCHAEKTSLLELLHKMVPGS